MISSHCSATRLGHRVAFTRGGHPLYCVYKQPFTRCSLLPGYKVLLVTPFVWTLCITGLVRKQRQSRAAVRKRKNTACWFHFASETFTQWMKRADMSEGHCLIPLFWNRRDSLGPSCCFRLLSQSTLTCCLADKKQWFF